MKTILGRPKTDEATHKRNRAISLTDTEYEKLRKQAAAAKMGVSAYIIYRLKLDK